MTQTFLPYTPELRAIVSGPLDLKSSVEGQLALRLRMSEALTMIKLQKTVGTGLRL